MSLHEIALEDNALDVKVTVGGSKGSLAMVYVLCHSSILLYQWQLTTKPPVAPVLKWCKELSPETTNHDGSVDPNIAFSSVGMDDSEKSNTEVASTSFRVTNNGSLYADQRLLSKNCTSFLVTPAHVIFTTGQHRLKFVHMAPIEGKSPEHPRFDKPANKRRYGSIARYPRVRREVPQY